MPVLKHLIHTLTKLVEREPRRSPLESDEILRQLETLLILQGRAFARQLSATPVLQHLHEAEFKVFSQFGEDGILQYLIRETQIKESERTFVEFGVQNYAESNTRFLLINNLWRGLVIDGCQQNIEFIRNQDYFWRHDLIARHAWIDRDNINSLIAESSLDGDLGVLSIDLDGNDYWVWERIHVVQPIIVVIEWNSAFGKDEAVSIPYDPAFQRERAHHSCVYWGASIRALGRLGESKGYALVGSNGAGNNLFFVRTDRLGKVPRVSAEAAYVSSCFRDSRDLHGRLNFLRSDARTEEVLDLPVVDVVTGDVGTLRALKTLRLQNSAPR